MVLFSDVLKKFQTDTVEILSQYFPCCDLPIRQTPRSLSDLKHLEGEFVKIALNWNRIFGKAP